MNKALTCADLWERVYLPALIDVKSFLNFRSTCKSAREIPISKLTMAKLLLPSVPEARLKTICDSIPSVNPSDVAHVVKKILFPDVPAADWPANDIPSVYAGIADRFFSVDSTIFDIPLFMLSLKKSASAYGTTRRHVTYATRSAIGRQKLLSALDLMPTEDITTNTELTTPNWRCKLNLVTYLYKDGKDDLVFVSDPSFHEMAWVECVKGRVVFRRLHVITCDLE
jgi:hypothetical protein